MLFPPDWFIWLPLIGKRKIGYKGICVDLFFWNYWLASLPNLMRPGGEGGNSSESGDGEGGERERRAICPGWRAYPSPHQPTWFPELSTREHTRVWGDLADTVSESSGISWLLMKSWVNPSQATSHLRLDTTNRAGHQTGPCLQVTASLAQPTFIKQPRKPTEAQRRMRTLPSALTCSVHLGDGRICFCIKDVPTSAKYREGLGGELLA